MDRIQTQIIEPKAAEVAGVGNPTMVRYGWMPFKNIYLYNGDGTPYYFIQPVNSPYHREIPKNQLIPFETFTKTRWEVNHEVAGEPGKPAPKYSITETVTAHDAATELLRTYSAQGYVVLNSLQGLPQADAFRIFQVVQPLDYRLAEIVGELEFGAEERIASEVPIDLSETTGEEYIIEPLQNDAERSIARRLVAEMLEGANRAYDKATEILNQTETEMIACYSGKKEGKKGADPLDKYLEKEMMKELPKLLGKDDKAAQLEQKVDFLVDREVSREMREENERLKKELEELRAARGGQVTDAPAAPLAATCLFIKDDGNQCKLMPLKGETLCKWHVNK